MAMGLIAIISLSAFSLMYFSDMKMRGDGTMSGCMFNGQAEICLMSPIEHLNAFQERFSAVPQRDEFFVFLFVLISAVGILLLFNITRHPLLVLLHRLFDQWRFYLKQNPDLSLFNLLSKAFAQGILNSRIYS